MKIRSSLFMISLFWLWPPFNINGQTQSPRKIDIQGNGNSISLKVLDLDPLDSGVGSYYDIFWIFNDGHYINQKGSQTFGVYNPPIPFDYSYNANHEMGKVRAFLTENYSNDDPPPDVLISNGDIPTPDPVLKTPGHPSYTSPDNNLFLDVNKAFVVQSRKIVFAISYKLEVEGQLHFFYNAKETPTGLIPTPGHLSNPNAIIPDQNLQKTINPNSNVDWGNQLNGFSDVISYEISADDKKSISGINYEEGRLFITLDAAAIDINDEYLFAVLLTEENSPLVGGSSRGDIQVINSLLNVSGPPYSLNTVSGTGTAPPTPNFFPALTGFHLISLQGVKTHDPNSICLTGICRCNKKKNQIENTLEYTLKFCNDTRENSSNTVYAATVAVEDLSNVFETLEFSEISNKAIGDKSTETYSSSKLELKFNNMRLLQNTPGKQYSDVCMEFKVKARLKNKFNTTLEKCDPKYNLKMSVWFDVEGEPVTTEVSDTCDRCNVEKSYDLPYDSTSVLYKPYVVDETFDDSFYGPDGKIKTCNDCRKNPNSKPWFKKPKITIPIIGGILLLTYLFKRRRDR